MILYYAGLDNHVADLYSALRAGGCRHLMLSYHYRRHFGPNQLKRYRRLGLHIFLDSGAYSAWTQGIEIDLGEYMRFIVDNRIGKYINLDVVGDPEQTYTNMKRMEAAGLSPVPVFHMGSDFKYLDRMVYEGYEYICLGGTVGAHTNTKIEFMDKVFRDYPDLFFHGLGINDKKLMDKYPWFSVDATTWLIGRKYNVRLTSVGRVQLPKDITSADKIRFNVEYLSKLEQPDKSFI